MSTKLLAKRIFAALLVVAMLCAVLVSCTGKKDDPADTGAVGTGEGTQNPPADKVYTYNDYLAVSPSNWNELTYQDNNDTAIMGYIGSGFFEYNFKFDANGNIVPGDFAIEYSAATKLVDVTAKYAEAWGLDATKTGYAYQITLREDLKWDDGTAIKAADFVRTMKEQLDPKYLHYRADSFYAGSVNLVNAENYAKQGQTIDGVDNSVTGKYTVADLVKGEDGVYTQPDGNGIWFALEENIDWCGGSVTDVKDYLDADAFAALVALKDEKGRVAITDETIALVTKLIDTDDWSHETPEYVPNYMVYYYEYTAIDFEKVGIFVGDTEYDIVIILANPLDLLKADGSLAYKAAYNLSSLPVVHEAKYEASKTAPAEGSELWTTNYNSSVETTASWGPYKLESFQAGKQYVLVKNDNWYGYNMDQYKGQYQTTRIVVDIIDEWNAAWIKFQAGELAGIGIDVSIAADYKGSDRAYFTPDDYVGSLQLQSDVEQLKAREEAGIDKEILGYTEFRKALSLGIDRADYAAKCTTSSLQGFGIFNSMHYYDVENGGAYRNTDAAKKVLCDIYNVDYTKYDTLDDAVNAITGYDLTAARALLTEAYNKAVADGVIAGTDKVKLVFGTGAITESTQRHFDYLSEAWKKMAETTPLEGRLEFELQDFAQAWANDFRAGKYDICMGGWTGAAWDPGYFLLAYLSPGYMYSRAWDTSSVEMTFTMPGVGEDGADVTDTMSLIAWYNCLNGASGAKYDWSASALTNEQRLPLIAALEKEVLKVYYTVPTYYSFGASLISYKVDYITYEYNTFMGYGGVRYMTYNYDDAAWEAAVAEQNGQLDYK